MPLVTDVQDQIYPPKPYSGDKMNQLFSLVVDPTSLIGDSLFVFQGATSPIITFSELPRNMTVSKSAVYNNDIIQGRTEPWKSYSHTEQTRITFDAKFVAQGKKKDGLPVNSLLGKALGLSARFIPSTSPFLGIAGNIATGLQTSDDESQWPFIIFEEVHQKVAVLEALHHAQYDEQGRAFPPPIVMLNFGFNFKPLRRGVITNVSFRYEGPWETETLLCYAVDCHVNFEEVNTRPKGYRQVADRQEPGNPTGASASVGDKLAQSATDRALSIIGL